MAVLVAGIGYIGARLVSDLLATGEEVVGVDNLFATDPAAIAALQTDSRFHFISGSVGNPRVLAAAFAVRPIELVYLLAAQASAHPRAASPRYTESTNLLAPRALLDAMRRYGARSLVFGSSLRVYGEEVLPTTADDAPYGLLRDLSHLSKVYVEKLIEMYAAQHGLRCIAARLGIVYGLSPVMKRDYRFMTAPNKFCLQLVRREEMIFQPGSQCVRGFLHVADASSALRALAAHDGFQGYTPVNVATEWTDVVAVAALAMRLAKERGLIASVSLSQTETIYQLGPRLAETGFQPAHTLLGSLGETIDYFRHVEKTNGGQAPGWARHRKPVEFSRGDAGRRPEGPGAVG